MQTTVIHTPIHNVWKGTRGTETSKYPEEEKEKSISLVAASERERAQTDLRIGVVGSSINLTEDHRGITWEGERERVRAPYSK